MSERRRKGVRPAGIPMIVSDITLSKDWKRKQGPTNIPTKAAVKATMGVPVSRMT